MIELIYLLFMLVNGPTKVTETLLAYIFMVTLDDEANGNQETAVQNGWVPVKAINNGKVLETFVL